MSAVYTSNAGPHELPPGGSPRPRGSRAGLPGVGGPLGIAGLCVVALATTWMVAALLPGGEFKDAVALHDFHLLSHTHAKPLANGMLALLRAPLYVVWALTVVTVALLRGRPRLALAAGLVMALAPLSAEVLKPLLAHPHVRIGATNVGPASWPSGNASAVLALALCAALVAPAAHRAFVMVLGVAFALAVGCSLLIRAWHMPSDVIGGYLLASLWMALAVAALRAADWRWPPKRGRLGAEPSGSGAGLGSGLGAMGARLPQ
jgi:membrane-associated phospholipid phosphatase